jgi:hypothetical protein
MFMTVIAFDVLPSDLQTMIEEGLHHLDPRAFAC